jgi:demethylmenaquinone methyltransferase/2-methoxy-6-polyprenyl-1,4-benzoquinol methylase
MFMHSGDKEKYTFFKFEGKWLRGYDTFNHIASLGLDLHWRRKTAQFLARQLDGKMSKAHVLDLACGTGDMAIAVREAHPAGIIIGTDPSRDMLAFGRNKLHRLAQNSVYLVNTVKRLPFPQASFDAISCAFGLRNFSDLEGDISEMYRLLKPQGRLYALEFYQPQTLMAKLLLALYRRTIFPLLGFLLTSNIKAYRYLFSSIFRFKTTDEFVQLLARQGFGPAKIKPFFFGLVHLVVAEKP